MLLSAPLFYLSVLTPAQAALTQGEAELAAVFDRAVGDSCKGSEGTGSCKSTASCRGISYTGLCPKDSADIKVLSFLFQLGRHANVKLAVLC